jgi:hypothetical protein
MNFKSVPRSIEASSLRRLITAFVWKLTEVEKIEAGKSHTLSYKA